MRALCSFLAAALVGLTVPGVAHAAVADRPVVDTPSFNDTVRTVINRGSTIYVGGEFTSVTDSTGTYARSGAAAVDATTGRVLPWNPRVNGTVREIAVAREGVYLGGRFSQVRGAERRNIAKVRPGGVGRLVATFRLTPNGPVKAIALGRGRAYIGGDFTKVNGKARSGLAAFSRKGSGRLLAGWRPKVANGPVLELVHTRSGVYVAGLFRSLNGRYASGRVALVTRKTGRTIRRFNPDMTRPVHDIAVTKRRVYLGIGGRGGGALAVARRNGNRLWWRHLDGDVVTVAMVSRELHLGGHFTEICGDAAQGDGGECLGASVKRMRGASLTRGGVLSGWQPDANSLVGITSLDAIPGSRLAVGGGFTAMNGGESPRGRFAIFNSVG